MSIAYDVAEAIDEHWGDDAPGVLFEFIEEMRKAEFPKGDKVPSEPRKILQEKLNEIAPRRGLCPYCNEGLAATEISWTENHGPGLLERIRVQRKECRTCGFAVTD